MKRDDCEKLLDAYGAAIEALYIGGSNERVECKGEVVDNLREVIVGIMADEKKPTYRDGGITVRNTMPNWADGGYTTTPTYVTKPVITCDGNGDYTERV